MEKDHLPTMELGAELAQERDKILLKNSDQIQDDEMLLLKTKERVDLAKFKVTEIKKQMKDAELQERIDIERSNNLVENVVEMNDFKQLSESKQLKYINDLCNEVLKNPKTDLDRVEILCNICDNRIIEEKVLNKAAMCSIVLLFKEITPDFRLRD